MFHRFVILFFVLILSSLLISAQEELPPEANACAEGGAMEGKCNIDFDGNGVVDDYEVAWAWTCGWYMVRYSSGIFAEVPSFCQSLLPSEPVDESGNEDSGLFCYLEVPDGVNIYPTDSEGSIIPDVKPTFMEGNPGYPPCPMPL
jgi:hypothetical protein